MPSSSVPTRFDARQAEAQRRVHVEMRVDEGRAEQPALRVDHLGAFGRGQVRPDGLEAAVVDQHALVLAAVD